MLLIKLGAGEWDTEDRTLRFARNGPAHATDLRTCGRRNGMQPRRNVALVSFSVLSLNESTLADGSNVR
jgi:hypothetical protein